MNKRKLSITSNGHFKKPNQNTQTIINKCATTSLETIFLNESKTSWMKLLKLTEPDGLTLGEFEELWHLKLAEKLKIKIAGKLIECPLIQLNCTHLNI